MSDETNVPAGYAAVLNDGRWHPRIEGPVRVDGLPRWGVSYATENEAVDACHAHRNRIAAEALREVAADWDARAHALMRHSVSYDAHSMIERAGELWARANALSPEPKEKPGA